MLTAFKSDVNLCEGIWENVKLSLLYGVYCVKMKGVNGGKM